MKVQHAALIVAGLLAWKTYGMPTPRTETTVIEPNGDIPATAAVNPVISGDLRTKFAYDFLHGLGNANPKEITVIAVVAWQRAEDGCIGNCSDGRKSAIERNNYLNTTQPGFNAVGPDFNSDGVKTYATYENGLAANLKCITNGFYPNMVQGLQTDNLDQFFNDTEIGTWGTGLGAVRRNFEEVKQQWARIEHVQSSSNPIAIGDDDCGYNVQVAIEAQNNALQHVTIAPGQEWSFNETMGNPGLIPYRTCAGVPGGNWCNLAARYAQVAESMGLQRHFQDHGIGDLGGGSENSVAIWNEGGQRGGQDLLITNTTNRTVQFAVQNNGTSITIVGGTT